MKKLLLVVCAICACLSSMSCSNDKDEDWSEDKTIEVASHIVPCKIWGDPDTVDGIEIRPIGASEWNTIPLYSIDGFKFEEGFSYVLKIQIIHLAEPPQDGSNIRYKLIATLSKDKEL